MARSRRPTAGIRPGLQSNVELGDLGQATQRDRGLDEAVGAYVMVANNLLEDDARMLRALWQRLADYPILWFGGFVAPAMWLDANHEYLLSSSKEALAHISSPAGSTARSRFR
jgi:hypothetical protein